MPIPSKKSQASRRAAAFVAAAIATCTVQGGARAHLVVFGQYWGAVVFDRWGECYLYNGSQAMLVEAPAREMLRRFRQKTVLLDVREFGGSIIPLGEPHVSAFTMVRRARYPRCSADIVDIRVSCRLARLSGATVRVMVTLYNSGRQERALDPFRLSPMLLAEEKHPFSPFETDPTTDVFASQTFGQLGWRSHGGGGYRFEVAPEDRPASLMLKPHRRLRLPVTLTVPPGKYDLLFSYGVGIYDLPAVTSNQVAFDVGESGLGHVVHVPGR